MFLILSLFFSGTSHFARRPFLLKKNRPIVALQSKANSLKEASTAGALLVDKNAERSGPLQQSLTQLQHTACAAALASILRVHMYAFQIHHLSGVRDYVRL